MLGVILNFEEKYLPSVAPVRIITCFDKSRLSNLTGIF
jgi:hypothetical protein